MFYEQLKRICASKGTTPTAVVRKIGISSGNVTSWKNGSSPKSETLQLLANELGVPIAAFFDVRTEPSVPDFSAEEIELVEVYRKLDKSGQRRLFGRAYELLDALGASHAGDTLTPPDANLAVTVIDSRIKK